MNKKGQGKWIYLVIGILVVFALVYYYGAKEEKQVPKPADITQEQGGTPYIRMRDEEGNEGEMLEDFYKVLGLIGSTIRGTTSVSCSIDQNCLDKCGGDTFCLDHIQCYENQCTYGLGTSGIQITQIALDAVASNTETADLEVYFDTAVTSPTSTAFGTSHSANIGTSETIIGGASHPFVGEFFNLAPYEGKTTTFTIGMHAIDQFSGVRYPASGTLSSSIVLVISADPIGGFSIQISQLPGI